MFKYTEQQKMKWRHKDNYESCRSYLIETHKLNYEVRENRERFNSRFLQDYQVARPMDLYNKIDRARFSLSR